MRRRSASAGSGFDTYCASQSTMTLSDTTQSATTFLDEAALLAKIVPALSGLQDGREKRAVVVTELRAARLSALATIEANLAAAPLAAQTAIGLIPN